MKEFLTLYYKQLHFNSMPVEVRAAFKKAADAGQLTKDMKLWMNGKAANAQTGAPAIDPLMPQTVPPAPPGPDLKNWAITMLNRDLPDAATELSPTELEKLFKAFQDAFRSMDASKKDFSDNEKALTFLKANFGANQLFSLATSDSALDADIVKLKNVLQNQSGYLSKWLKINGNFFEDIGEYNEFIGGLTAVPPKYNTDAKFQKKLKDIADYLSYGLQQGAFEKDQALESALVGISPELGRIKDGFDSNAPVNPTKLAYFKDNYATFLGTLYKESKVLDVFSSHDGGKISKPLATARDAINYDKTQTSDGKANANYLTPVTKDKLNLVQQISEWAGDTFDDYLKKYTSLRGDRLFFSDDAKLICRAFDKVGTKPADKIKPSDGLDGILSKAAKVGEKLPPVAREKFEYFTKSMSAMKSKMPKAYAKALQNGTSLRAMVSEMILDAVRDGKVEECKAAMEVLSVIKYGWVTSRVMEALRSQEFTLLSDSKMTWNKQAGTQFVTKALDKGLKTAFLGVGYAITITGNAIISSNNKFHGRKGRMRDAIDTQMAKNDADKQALEQTRNNDTARRDAAAQGLQNLNLSTGINDTNIDTHRTQLEQHRQSLSRYEQDVKDAQEKLDNIAQLQQDISRYTQWANDPVNQNNPQMPQVVQALAQMNTQMATEQANSAQYTQNLQVAQHNYNTQEPITNDLADKIADFDNATNEVKFLSDQIDRHDETLAKWDDNHKDKYKELMAHWDLLESGTTKSWNPLSRGFKQKSFDKNKAAHIANFQNNYSYAA